MSYEVDWTPLLTYPPNMIECRCGAHYRSHAKFVGATCTTHTKEPCPGCGMTHGHVRASRSEPEVWMIHGGVA